MKRIIYPFIALLLICFSVRSSAQTTLLPGDLMIIGWNAEDNTVNGVAADDDICFILMKNVVTGTSVYFTDLGWTGSGFQQNANNGCAVNTGAANDGCIKWTATSGMTAGTKVRVGCHSGLTATSGSVIGILAAPSGGYVSLATATDQIFAFQGSLASPALVAAFNYGSSNWSAAGAVTTCTFTSTASVDPNASVNNYAFTYASISSNNNGKYNGPTNLSGPALRAAVLNAANWVFNDGAPYTFPQSLTFILLPVQLISFTGKTTASGNLLEWKVATEESFSHYELETSNDGVTYTMVTSIPGMHKENYSFLATPSQNQYQYYRLKMVDIDFKFKYSNVIRMQNDLEGQKLSVYPNPVKSSVNISAGSPIIEMTISDMSGKRLTWQKGNHTNTERIDMTQLKPGTYIISVLTAKGQLTEKVSREE